MQPMGLSGAPERKMGWTGTCGGDGTAAGEEEGRYEVMGKETQFTLAGFLDSGLREYKLGGNQKSTNRKRRKLRPGKERGESRQKVYLTETNLILPKSEAIAARLNWE